jgi:dTDP-4-dehydrorhamnose reductase
MEANAIQLWGGIECTINRVNDRYFNQLELSGHWHREDDLEQIARLGLRTLRFPVLWESLAPDSLDQINWSWPDARLSRLRALGIRPIVGLLHHGSGPRYTSLLDPDFPTKLARFASMVARRYPWIDAYIPINEPLTTARFSALYGHWYPHARDNSLFARALLNQVRAIILAMEAVRAVNSKAILVQTEDLGRTFSTSRLRYQADFENARRWLTWDLLRGEVGGEHAMRSFLLWTGVAPQELDWFAEHSCCPDIIGINYYVTSERYLDENIHNYPCELHGTNGRDTYADDAAVRARQLGLAGVRAAIAETYRRYAAPIALTEVHLGCTVDEQIRWFMEAWQAAEIAHQRGMDVRAVTAWALLGSFDWDSLVTRPNRHYEPSAFDVRGGRARPTAFAEMLTRLAQEKYFTDPILRSTGWWRRRSRLRGAVKDALAA